MQRRKYNVGTAGLKKIIRFYPKIEMRLTQNNSKQSTAFHIDVVTCLFIPPNILNKLD